VASLLQRNDGHQELAAKARDEAIKLLKARVEEPDASASALASMARICIQDEQPDTAIQYYRRALALDYGQVGWRLSLARALVKVGKFAEAMHEARICLRLRPQMQAAKKLIEELSVHPDALAQE